MNYEIFKSIPHERIVMKQTCKDEVFDLYQCGVFENNSTKENIELVELQPLSEYSSHFHEASSAVIYVISGKGLFRLADDVIDYQPGVRIDIPAGMSHGFRTNTATLFLSIQSPPIINSDNGEIDFHYATGEIYGSNT